MHVDQQRARSHYLQQLGQGSVWRPSAAQGQVASLAAPVKQARSRRTGQEACRRHRCGAGGRQPGGHERARGRTGKAAARLAGQDGNPVHLLELGGEVVGTVTVGLALGLGRGTHNYR